HLLSLLGPPPHIPPLFPLHAALPILPAGFTRSVSTSVSASVSNNPVHLAGDRQPFLEAHDSSCDLRNRIGNQRRRRDMRGHGYRSEEHTSELQSLRHLVCRLLLEKKK